jgi:hypothetical protein
MGSAQASWTVNGKIATAAPILVTMLILGLGLLRFSGGRNAVVAY